MSRKGDDPAEADQRKLGMSLALPFGFGAVK